ncbi:hypothetical protein QVA72_01540 [Staphylococcus simulans]|uniref:hypothetical protein n=1 Tax=Staphylococcus simulans TaxID=1286 RepID=UPI000D026BEF|nr:hypothetical protein [Staphylococcus simulans]MCE5023459.1 hypothetical protein [Staphylococcus simulans]MDU0420327.1 hypothetical protein [Staphylococcus simulans]MDU0466186.1 hypothetical protein [Staphylococcus simulans]MEB6835656.1 hypothetical protein [Staphylococcus simulans]PTJ23015.1 hypothetical protein BU039_06295 [Staphylococcus simulans]
MIINYLSIKDIQILAGVSKSKASTIVRELNSQLEEEGFIAIRGKLPIQLVREKFPYCDLSDEVIKELKEANI